MVRNTPVGVVPLVRLEQVSSRKVRSKPVSPVNVSGTSWTLGRVDPSAPVKNPPDRETPLALVKCPVRSAELIVEAILGREPATPSSTPSHP